MLTMTLRSFFAMPASAKPTPPQQSSLSELWKKGSKQKEANPDPSTSAAAGDRMDIDTAPVASSSQPTGTITEQGMPITSSVAVKLSMFTYFQDTPPPSQEVTPTPTTTKRKLPTKGAPNDSVLPSP